MNFVMEVKIDKYFQKDVKKIKDRAILRKIADSIINAQQAGNLNQIKRLKN